MSEILTPLADRVVVRPDAPDEKTAAGILIPDSARPKPQRGTVLAVGPGRTTDDGQVLAPQVRVGETVLFGKNAGTDLDVNGERVLLLREAELFAVLV